jgi:dihydroorotase
MSLLLKNVRAIDPAAGERGLDAVVDIHIKHGEIVEVGPHLDVEAGEVHDLTGKVVVPGLVDMHVHLREPGHEYKETIESGTRAAVHGGFTGVAPMANTNPVIEDGTKVRGLLEKADECAFCHVYPVGACTKKLMGSELSEMGDMVAAGAVAFSDDGKGIQDAGMMRRVMDYAKMFGKVVMAHEQDDALVGPGIVNEGPVSTNLGLAAWPAEGEEVMIARDIALCRLTGCALHVQHITTARGVELVRTAKEEGLPVTCEVTPHHLFLSEDDVSSSYDTNFKMNPPLRTKADCTALIGALADGTVDAIATDHAPHAKHEKAREFELAPFGTTGLETALPLVLTELVSTGKLSWERLVEVMSILPREILGIDPVSLQPGFMADLTVIDPDKHVSVTADWFESEADNSAFLGRELTGCATTVFIEGYAALLDGEVVDR